LHENTDNAESVEEHDKYIWLEILMISDLFVKKAKALEFLKPITAS